MFVVVDPAYPRLELWNNQLYLFWRGLTIARSGVPHRKGKGRGAGMPEPCVGCQTDMGMSSLTGDKWGQVLCALTMLLDFCPP
jgi:hypothetical protein